jgi:hypothetical protein
MPRRLFPADQYGSRVRLYATAKRAGHDVMHWGLFHPDQAVAPWVSRGLVRLSYVDIEGATLTPLQAERCEIRLDRDAFASYEASDDDRVDAIAASWLYHARLSFPVSSSVTWCVSCGGACRDNRPSTQAALRDNEIMASEGHLPTEHSPLRRWCAACSDRSHPEPRWCAAEDCSSYFMPASVDREFCSNPCRKRQGARKRARLRTA